MKGGDEQMQNTCVNKKKMTQWGINFFCFFFVFVIVFFIYIRYLWLYGWLGLDKLSLVFLFTFGFTLLTCFVEFIIVIPTEFRWFLIAETQIIHWFNEIMSYCIFWNCIFLQKKKIEIKKQKNSFKNSLLWILLFLLFIF